MQPVKTLALLIVALLAVATVYFLSPAKKLVESRNHAIDQLYLAHFTERISSLLGNPDRVSAQVASNPQIPAPKASATSGFFETPVEVQFDADIAAAEIYFTTDGSIPTPDSRRYSAPIEIRESTTLRARVLVPGRLPGAVATETYIVGEDLQLPILALTSDPNGLFDDWAGIFKDPFERGKAWRRPAKVTYISASRDQVVQLEAGIKIHGNYTRELPKKSLRLFYAAENAQSESLPQVLRPVQGATEHQVVLRQGGDDHTTRIRSMLFDSLLRELGGITTHYETVFVFINGDPIGVYNVRDYIDIHFLRRNFGSGDYDLIVDGVRPKAGKMSGYSEFLSFLRSHDLADEKNFERASSIVDVQNTLDYWLANIYAASTDWPGRNTYIFRATDRADRKWRWISWDKDVSFNKYDTELEHNTLAYAIRDSLRDDLLWHYAEFDQDTEHYLAGTLIIRKLLENRVFRNRFVTRCLDLLNTTFSPENVERHLQTIIDAARSDVARDWQIWSFDEERYRQEVERIRHFARHRPAVVRQHLRDAFEAGNEVELRLEVAPPGAGTIALNSVRPSRYPWRGVYLENLELSLAAEPEPGYRFVGWGGVGTGDEQKVSVVLTDDARFVANFEALR